MISWNAEQFATGPYANALMRGDCITDAEKNEITQKVARFTGLTPEYVAQSNMRIRIDRFDKELLRDQRRTAGRYDGRFKGMDRDAAGERNDFDPSYAAAYNDLAVGYEHEGQLEKARQAYEKALELEPNNPQIRQNYELFKEINDRTGANKESP